MVLNEFGRIVQYTWNDLPAHNKHIGLDEYIIMPNHIHGIIKIVRAGSKPARMKINLIKKPDHKKNDEEIGIWKRVGLEPTPTNLGLPEIIRQFKTFSARRINRMNRNIDKHIWQKSYYDHIIRNELSLEHVREYIINNPAKWADDENNPANIS